MIFINVLFCIKIDSRTKDIVSYNFFLEFILDTFYTKFYLLYVQEFFKYGQDFLDIQYLIFDTHFHSPFYIGMKINIYTIYVYIIICLSRWIYCIISDFSYLYAVLACIFRWASCFPADPDPFHFRLPDPTPAFKKKSEKNNILQKFDYCFTLMH